MNHTNQQLEQLAQAYLQDPAFAQCHADAVLWEQTAVADHHPLYQAALKAEAFDQQHPEEITDFICTHMDGLNPHESFDSHKLTALCKAHNGSF
jgi:hypothetical protein